MPFYVGAAAFALAIGVLATGHKQISAAERSEAEGEPEQPIPTPKLQRAGAAPAPGYRPVIVAVGATEDADSIVDAAVEIARSMNAPVEVVHVRETAVVEEVAIDVENAEQAHAAVRAHLDRLLAHGVAATGQLLTSVGDHATAGRILAQHADNVEARAIALGRSSHRPLAQFTEGSFAAAVTRAAHCTVVLLEPGRAPRLLSEATLDELRREIA
jgi:nucleotide-binding universal stress UspA family protein